MSTLRVEFLQPGMELAEDVRGSNGLVLLGAGAEISERHIQIFKSWGVPEVTIRGGGPGDAAATPARTLSDAEREVIERELDRLFQHNDPLDPVIEELRRICLQRETVRKAAQP
ncbi:MAG TPA: hypothetical protein DCY13_19960 [Verrucomicrobiales bacterium]|nr:hypothetical protein [Verrucomicrobiales bacterium]